MAVVNGEGVWGDDWSRVQRTARRRKILEGSWQVELETDLRKALGKDRTTNLGRLTRSMNLAKSATEQLAILYDLPVSVGHEDPRSLEMMRNLMRAANFQSLAKHHARRVIGLRESLIRVEYAESTGRVWLRMVGPDEVEITADDDDPGKLLEVRYARKRTTTDGKKEVFFDVWNAEDGTTRIETTGGKDVTGQFFPDGITPTTDADGVIPVWTLYHAEDTGRLWNTDEWCEVFDGAMDVAILWNGHLANLRDSSWAQRGTMDCEPVNMQTGPNGTANVTVDATALLPLRSMEGRSGSTFQWNPAVEPHKMAEAILAFQKTLMATIQLYPGDLQERRAESGIAIHIKRSGQRRYAKSTEPQFRAGDEQVMEAMARMARRFGGVSMAPDGYTIAYNYLDDPVGERLSELEYNMKLVEAGLLAPVDFYRKLHPNVGESEALDALMRARVQSMAIERAMGFTVLPNEMVDQVDAAAEAAQQALSELDDSAPESIRNALRLAAMSEG